MKRIGTRYALLAATALSSIAVVACGSSEGDNGFPGQQAQDTTGSTSSSSGGSDEPVGQFSSGGSTSSSGGSSSSTGGTCAAVSAPAKLQDVNLVMLLDRSGSMGNMGKAGDNTPTRWTPVTGAIKSFVADSTVAGMKASLTLFPARTGDICSGYETADAAMGAIPNRAISSLIDSTYTGGGTPLRDSLKGVVAQASAYAAAHPDEKTVVVVATDGEPSKCALPDYPNATQAAAEVARIRTDVSAVAATTPVYVIGVGSSLTYLNSIAEGGGTGAATLVEVGDPAATGAQFLATLKKIRQDSISCNVNLPAPPDGRKLDVNKVSVKSAGNVLTYSADCSAANAWRYDSVTNPTQVILCDASCSTVRQSGKGLDVSFECEDKQVAVPR
jgi:hypothetical protein